MLDKLGYMSLSPSTQIAPGTRFYIRGEERCLLHVAATRTKNSLLVTADPESFHP